MSNNVFKFTIDEKEYEVEKIIGRAARRNMLKIVSLFSKIVNATKENGVSLDSLFNSYSDGENVNFSIFFDEIVNILVAVGPVLSDDKTINELESLLPVILGLSEEFLENNGDALEVYSAAIGAMLFHIGLNMTEEASESLRNFTPQSGQVEPEKTPRKKRNQVNLEILP